MTHYLISREYVGTDYARRHGPAVITIDTYPATTISGEAVTSGMVGEIDGWLIWAHGAYDTLDAARAAVTQHCYRVREVEDTAYAAEYRAAIRKSARA